MSATVEEIMALGISFSGFKEFVKTFPDDQEIVNYENTVPSYNFCAIGLYVKSLGSLTDFNRRRDFNSARNLGLAFKNILPDGLFTRLDWGGYLTYGELKKDLENYS